MSPWEASVWLLAGLVIDSQFVGGIQGQMLVSTVNIIDCHVDSSFYNVVCTVFPCITVVGYQSIVFLAPCSTLDKTKMKSNLLLTLLQNLFALGNSSQVYPNLYPLDNDNVASQTDPCNIIKSNLWHIICSLLR